MLKMNDAAKSSAGLLKYADSCEAFALRLAPKEYLHLLVSPKVTEPCHVKCLEMVTLMQGRVHTGHCFDIWLQALEIHYE